MRYLSTRGSAPALAFDEVLLAGLARDGGLYVPEAWPQFSAPAIAALAGKTYAQVTAEVTFPFVAGVIGNFSGKSFGVEQSGNIFGNWAGHFLIIKLPPPISKPGFAGKRRKAASGLLLRAFPVF